MAGILKAGGSDLGQDARRAQALGVLASSPARALQLLQADLLDQLPLMTAEGELDGECPARGQRGHTCGSVDVDPDRLLPRSTVYVHVSDETLGTGDGLVRAEGLRPQLAGWLEGLLGGTKVKVTPVLDLANMAPADAYEVPERMREAVSLRSPRSVFPWSRRRSRGLDMDHTAEYRHQQWRGAGQTRLENLDPLTRRQHRAKTHGGYRVEQLRSGVFLWQTPLGQRMLVTPSGTQRLMPARS